MSEDAAGLEPHRSGRQPALTGCPWHDVNEMLQAAGLRDRVKVLIGGAPVTKQFAAEIGADGYGDNATMAVSLARSFTKDSGAA